MMRHYFRLGVFLGLIGCWSTLGAAAEVEELVYRETPQGTLKLSVHYPPQWKATDRRPAIVFFFGGGWTGGTTTQFEPQATYLASRGMVAARADYRVKSRHQVTPDECVRDAQAAVRYLRENANKLGIDPQRIVASGGSAGGHLAACTGLVPPLDVDAEKAVSSRANVLLLFNPALKFSGVETLMSRINGDEKLAHAISPTLHVSKESPPSLLFFGTSDLLIVQGREFLDAAAKAEARAEMFTAEGQAHGFFNRSPWRERTLRRADEFLTSLGYLAGPPTIVVPE